MPITLDAEKNVFVRILSKITDTTEISHVSRRLLGITCMTISVLLSLKEYSSTEVKEIFFWKIETLLVLNIQPTFISTLCAVFLIFPLFFRDKKKLSTYAILTILLNTIFCASFLNFFVGKEIWDIPLINISSQAFLMFAILVSWIGMRSIAGFVWIFLFTLSLFKMASGNAAFGLAGVAYVLCAFISIICQSYDLTDNFVASIKNEFFSTTSTVKGDIDAANTVMTDTIDKATNAVGKAI